MASGKKKKQEDAPEADAGEEQKPKKSKLLLLIAVVTCLVSMGGGFFLARMAYQNDAAAYEPDYVDEEGEEGEEKGDDYAEGKDKMDKDGKVIDPLAKDGHPAEEAMALKDEEKDKGKDEKGAKDDGLMPFNDFLTNIESMDANGAPKRAFLKMNLVMVYRTEEGASDKMKEREPFIRDLFNSYLRGLTESDVRGMAGVLLVKAELLKRARAAVGSDLPQEILINDLIVQ